MKKQILHNRFFSLTLSVMSMIIMPFNATESNTKNDELKMSLLIIEKEVSKDSHTVSYEITITGQEVSYRWDYYGYPDDKTKNETFRLSDKAYSSLLEYLAEEEIQQNIEEIRSTEGIGLSVSMNLQLTLHDKTTCAKISGMYNRWDVPREQSCNIKNIEYYHRVYHIISLVSNRE